MHLKSIKEIDLKSNKAAFTLIELLVVIAIIGLLATIAVISLNNARAKARDAKRVADIKQVQTALELFYNDQGRYPNTTEFTSGSIYSTSTNGTTTYMQTIPAASNPPDGTCVTSQNEFKYVASNDGTSYAVGYCLGGVTGSLAVGTKCLSPNGTTDAGRQFCGFLHCGDSGIYDGEIYFTVQVGTQCWFAKNLNIGTRVNGSTNQSDYSSGIQKYCYNDHEINPSPATINCDNGQECGGCDTDGGLYQWGEAMQYSSAPGAQGICPTSWHIPTDAEQNILDQYLNDTTCDPNRTLFDAWGCANAGTKLKPTGSSGFEGNLAGYRYTDGSFQSQGTRAYFWSSSINTGSYIWNRVLNSSNANVGRSDFLSTHGFSVRCLKD